MLDDSFERPDNFDIHEFAAQSFGVFQNDQNFCDVVWRFLPEAAAQAKSYQFHPKQVMEEQSDGSLIVRFSASGQLEMAWHLYMWGDKVEIIEPQGLKSFVERFQRNDFPAMP